MIAIDAGETRGGIRLWICYSWRVHIWKILSKDPKMQRRKALSFLVTFLPAVSKMAEFFSSHPLSDRGRASPERVSVCVLWFPTWEHNCILKGINRYIQMKCLKSRTGQCESWMSVWVPSASHSGPLGQGAQGCSWQLLMSPFLSFPFGLAWEGWKMWESLVSRLRSYPGLLSWWQKQHDKEEMTHGG